ncbi:CHAT domain-containing protein [Leptolyngbyaceae cyanobacterium CCMR0082]|uniref:CHAT domain-containing protein n=1 Tax=Adonisia turfae CCMR0082 TaxID=2304604 RepID=A0A6M0S399_9CYAN|nr:CHAT domain-containing protein [Adonisia turfae]NEZ62866.1 CHAT domain-containing protein [Adonisia turfae CCMR0082]
MLNRLFGRQPTPPEEPPVDYADLSKQIMEGLAAGWSAEQVKACLAGRENDQKFVEWLYHYGKREQIDPAVAERLVQWGEIGTGAIAQMAKDIGEKTLNSQPKSMPKLSPSERDKQLELLLAQSNDAFGQGDFLESIAACNKALAIKSDSYAVLCIKALSLFQLRHYRQAAVTFGKVLAIEPQNYQALCFKGACLCELQEHENALIDFDKALSIKPDFYNALVGKAEAVSKLENYQEALSVYDKVLDIKPNNHVTLFNRATCLSKLERYIEAIEAYDEALTIKSDYHEALGSKGDSLASLGAYEEAIEAYDDALAIKSDYYQALQGKGQSLTAIKRIEEALSIYEQALAIQRTPDLSASIGVILNNFKHYQKAIKFAELALELDENHAHALYVKGYGLSGLRLFEEALFAVDKALVIESSNLGALRLKGTILKDLGNFQESILYFDAALSVAPNDIITLNNKGLALWKLGYFEEAISNYDRVLEQDSDYYPAWVNRGLACKDSCLQLRKSYLFPSALQLQKTELQERGYQGALICYQIGLKNITQETEPYGWGLLHRYTGEVHYFQDCYDPTQLHEALTEYGQALTTLTAEAYPIEHLKTLQLSIRANLGLRNTDQVRTLRQKALIVFQDLINEATSDAQRRRIETQFSGLSHLQVDLLLAEGLTTEALLAAERYKNRVLTWILDHWQEQTISPSRDQIHTLLSPQTAIIYWHLSDDTLSTFVITDSASITADTQPSQPLETWLKTWTRDYNDYRTKGKSPSAPLAESRETHPWRTELTNRLNELKPILSIDELVKNLSNIQNLVLIPHRDLHCLSLHTLFPENLTITYLPSAQIGLNLQNRPTIAQTKPLLIDSPLHTDLPPLLFADLETALLNQLFQTYDTQPNLIPYDQATTDHLTTQLSQPHCLLHFTGHAAYNQRHPENSSLALTDTDQLTAKDISALNLQGYGLISLSACETAITGTDTITTEYVGLVSAFLKAGAAQVLSTLWTVESRSNAWLMVYFYQRYLSGTPAPIALHQAQTWLRSVTRTDLAQWLQQFVTPELQTANPSEYRDLTEEIKTLQNPSGTIPVDKPLFADPYYWAAFTLTGHSHAR